jgi:uncharacterized protein YllA (UPF0747 family)
MSSVVSWPVSSAPAAGFAASAPAREKHLTAALARRWDASLAEWSAPAAVCRSRERLADPDCRVVVTGQQPGVWGGPLYSLYKAATAVALARRLTGAGGGPAVPVFWVQGDDTDWDEVGWGALPRRDLGIVRHRWHPGPVPARHWVGSAALEPVPGMSAVFAEWGDAGSFDLEPVPGRDLVHGFVRCLLDFFGKDGLVPLDSRWPELRAAGAPLWERYVPRHRQLARAVGKAGERLAREGGAAPLDAEAADFGLFLLDGEHRLPVDPGTWEAAAATLAVGRPRDLAPSVLLRAVLQDHLLGTTVHVVGRAEAAYLRQLAPVYDALSVLPPLRASRLHATVLPAGTIPASEVAEALKDPDAWIRGRVAAYTPRWAEAHLAALGKETADRLDAVAAGGETDLAQLADAARRKIAAQLQRLHEALDRQARRDLYRDHPRLRHLGEFLHPRRGPQDRGLSGASLAFFFGPEAPAVILDAARSHLDRLESGHEHHFALEATRD